VSWWKERLSFLGTDAGRFRRIGEEHCGRGCAWHGRARSADRLADARGRQIARVELQVDDRIVGGVPHLFAAMVASPACGDSMRRMVVTLGYSRRR
jgi:hypothetical protein